ALRRKRKNIIYFSHEAHRSEPAAGRSCCLVRGVAARMVNARLLPDGLGLGPVAAAADTGMPSAGLRAAVRREGMHMAATQEGTTAGAFVKYQESVASRLRYELAQHNLEQCHNLHRSLNVLDAAGGNGLNAEYFLRLGHRVTLLDYDPAMLGE